MILRNPYRDFEKAISYRFKKKKRLEDAFTHPSFRHETDSSMADNQRLEFLGDAALGLVAASRLFAQHKDCQEGELTRMRSSLTSTKALARAAASVDLGRFLRLGKGEKQSGGHSRESTLSDAFEAVVGAAYLDGGIKAVERIFDKIFKDDALSAGSHSLSTNPKGTLQELVQQEYRTSPTYEVLRESGPAHARHYTVQVRINGTPCSTGEGRNKRDAEVDAAQNALKQWPFPQLTHDTAAH